MRRVKPKKPTKEEKQAERERRKRERQLAKEKLQLMKLRSRRLQRFRGVFCRRASYGLVLLMEMYCIWRPANLRRSDMTSLPPCRSCLRLRKSISGARLNDSSIRSLRIVMGSCWLRCTMLNGGR